MKKEFFLNTDKLKIFVKNLHGSRAVFFVSGGKEIRIMEETFRNMMRCYVELKFQFSSLKKEIRSKAKCLQLWKS